MTQEEIETEAPKIVEEVTRFLRVNPQFDYKDEAIIYALAQIVQNYIEGVDMGLEEKGAMVTTIMSGFQDMNKAEIAFFNQRLKMMIERKSATVH